jgi:predicted membrane channel-forming protein YqfA (hemolysin III family)
MIKDKINKYRRVDSSKLIIGLLLMIIGGYLFLQSIQVVNNFSFSGNLFHIQRFNMTPGIILIPFLFGIAMIFYNPENDIGWILAILSIIILVVGVITNLQFRMRPMSAFELLMILGFIMSGLGIFLSAWRIKK